MRYPRYSHYRDSGVKWLGNVPQAWEVKRLKYIASINDEALPETTSPDYELLYVDIGNVDSIHGITLKAPMLFEDAPSRARRVVRHGDAIISTVRTYLRAVAPIRDPEENLIVSTGFAVIRPRAIDADYLSYALRSSYFIETVVSRSVGVSYPATNASDISCIDIPLPSPMEQCSVVSFLDAKLGMLDKLITVVGTAIERLQEYRTALITAAVTGKIDVRKAIA